VGRANLAWGRRSRGKPRALLGCGAFIEAQICCLCPAFAWVFRVLVVVCPACVSLRLRLCHRKASGQVEFGFTAWPNKSVKGTRRPLAVLGFGFLSRFGGFAQVL